MSTSIDTNALKVAINVFKLNSKPINGDSSAPCTVGDIKKVVNNMADLMATFVNEIENTQ